MPQAPRWRTRADVFEEVWGELRELLEINPGLEAKTLFDYLQRLYPGRFGDGQLDVNLDDLYIEISKPLWNGTEDAPKTEAGNRSLCLSPLLGMALKEYIAGRSDGYLFQTSEGTPWDASDVLVRK